MDDDDNDDDDRFNTALVSAFEQTQALLSHVVLNECSFLSGGSVKLVCTIVIFRARNRERPQRYFRADSE